MIDRSQVERILNRLPQVEREMAEPAVASNRVRMRELLREHAALKKLGERADIYFGILRQIEEHKKLLVTETDAELRQMAEEELAKLQDTLPAAQRDLILALLPPDPYDGRNAIMEIRAGTGGEEAALFAADLFRMYSRYVGSRGWKVRVVDVSPTEIGGYKEIVFSVEGEGAYGRLKYESGTHRVQRVPVTEAQGRIHTSAATVAVFPEVEPDDDIEIRPEDIRIDVFRASGPGGQSVNRTDSAVRITHLPTGIVVRCQDEKSQHRNKERALSVLKARLLAERRREEAERISNARRLQIGTGDRSERIRTYNFPQNRLTDHRINLTLYNLDRIMEGEIDEVISALHEDHIRKRLAEPEGGTGFSPPGIPASSPGQ
ncbi:MAG: peptide chain release factor 1 [Kiritimatiellae bacterium]|nr:peptide chain release factor 1 [Kiritimatiellia bacterium]